MWPWRARAGWSHLDQLAYGRAADRNLVRLATDQYGLERLVRLRSRVETAVIGGHMDVENCAPRTLELHGEAVDGELRAVRLRRVPVRCATASRLTSRATGVSWSPMRTTVSSQATTPLVPGERLVDGPRIVVPGMTYATASPSRNRSSASAIQRAILSTIAASNIESRAPWSAETQRTPPATSGAGRTRTRDERLEGDQSSSVSACRSSPATGNVHPPFVRTIGASPLPHRSPPMISVCVS